MAFCNKCGANLDAGTRFCNKCGAAVLASTLPPAASAASASSTAPAVPAAAAPPPPSGGALKVILVVVGVVVLVGILGVASIGFFAWRVARSSHLRQQGDHVKVETPFGTVESTKDPEEAARNLGIDVYPGARVLKEGAASATFGGIHTTTANFESDDAVEKVCAFYKSKFPGAMVTTSERQHCTIVSNDRKNMININIEAEGDKTRIQVSDVMHSPESAKPSSN